MLYLVCCNLSLSIDLAWLASSWCKEPSSIGSEGTLPASISSYKGTQFLSYEAVSSAVEYLIIVVLLIASFLISCTPSPHLVQSRFICFDYCSSDMVFLPRNCCHLHRDQPPYWLAISWNFHVLEQTMLPVDLRRLLHQNRFYSYHVDPISRKFLDGQ